MAQAADVACTHSPVAGSAARRPAARGWSCKWRQLFESLFLLSLAFMAKLSLGAAAAPQPRSARAHSDFYYGRETTDGKLEFWINWCFLREEG